MILYYVKSLIKFERNMVLTRAKKLGNKLPKLEKRKIQKINYWKSNDKKII